MPNCNNMTTLKTWKELAETTDLDWPEWEEEGVRYRLQWESHNGAWMVEWLLGGKSKWWECLYCPGDHEAESLFERHARRKLEKQGIAVCYGVNSERYFLKVGHAHYRPHELSDALAALGDFDTYVAAQQAAVRAAHEEGKESP